jgi:hypothetical protein
VGPVVVVLDVGADHLPGLLEGLELVAPDAALLQVAEPALDERLALRVTVAATAVSDTAPGENEPRGSCGECRTVVRPEGECPREDGLLGHRALDHGDRLDSTAAEAEL